MDKITIEEYRQLFSKELFNNCVPFWMKYGWDRENGGIKSYLARNGENYSTNKSVWIQGRFMWTLSFLCNQYGKRDEWLQAAESCKEFLDAYCFDKDGRMFFQVTDQGKPVRKRRYYFSEAFYIMAFAEYGKATGDRDCILKARKVYDMVLGIYKDPSSDPHQVYPKFDPSYRKMQALGGPMIMLNVTNIMRYCDVENTKYYDEAARGYIGDILNRFYRPELKCVLENIASNGDAMLDIPAGRLVNPGHSMEAAWFLFNEAKYFKDNAILKKGLDILEWSLEIGWDQKYGGIRYFTDIFGFPPEQYEHDMKLWWPHCEAIIAVLMAYEQTGEHQWSQWFEKLVDYSFRYLKDDQAPEWVGYLLRDNSKQQPVTKGNNFKGPFHLPRMLIVCDKILEGMLEKQ